ncbi:hypothetical protein FB451DRAFT_1191390 [Mycena latifolia]|nr:hypothetical protein FB451DRAFT_1191390 [Mycena latifolia]
MSTHTRPDSGIAALTTPRRIAVACVKCRAGKIKCISPGDGQPCARCTKRRLECEYLAVPDQQARDGLKLPGATGDLTEEAHHTRSKTVARHRAPRSPIQPQNPAARDYIPYSFASTANQPPLAHPSSNQQPGAPGHPSEYQQYLANFGLNAISHPAVMFPKRCTCVPGHPCYRGGTR